MNLRTKLISLVALVASAVALAAAATPAQARLFFDPQLPPKTPRPDLTVSSILTTWTHFTVANVGNAPAGPFTVAVGPRYEPDCYARSWFAPPVWKGLRVDGLAVGASIQLEAGLALISSRERARPTQTQWARYIMVDYNREVLEVGESTDSRVLQDPGNNLAFLLGQFYPCPT